MYKLLQATLLLSLAGSMVCYAGPDAPATTDIAWDRLPHHPVHTDHAFFFFEPFADGPAVTGACLDCHPDSAREVMQTAHWNWQGEARWFVRWLWQQET